LEAAASANAKCLLKMLVDDFGQLKHRHLRLAKDLPQFLVGIDHPLVDFVLKPVLLDVIPFLIKSEICSVVPS